jgi:uncharacterized membrane protein
MAYTSPTEINASRGIISILEYVNEVTDFWISRMLMVAIFVIFFMGYLRSKNDDDFLGALAVASYTTLVIGVIFFIIGFLDGVAFGIIIAVAMISTFFLLMDRRGQ